MIDLQLVERLTDDGAYLRGRYLTSYAQCEFLLADIAVKLTERFRYPLKDRVNAVKAMASTGGPLSSYADELLPMVDGIHAWTERRHWMAHGFLTLGLDPAGYHLFDFQYYEPQKGGKIQKPKHYIVTTGDLQNDVDAINRYCVAFVALKQRIYSELKID